ncbi:putative periplasmic lipoprotein [Rufibacter soli]
MAPLEDTAYLIIPGEQIGQLKLGDSPEKVQAALGKPDAGDAAMGKALSSWFSYQKDSTILHRVDVFTVREHTGMPDETVGVNQIRITSPRFSLQGHQLQVGSTLANLRPQFPGIRPVAYYLGEEKKRVYVYDAPTQGIVFEINGSDSICVAISIHAKGQEIKGRYLPVHPNLVNLNEK